MAALKPLKPLRPLRGLPEPDPRKTNEQRIAVLSLKPQPVIKPQPVPHSLIAGYAVRLERIAARAYSIADQTVGAAVRRQMALAYSYQPSLRGDEEKDIDPDHPHGEVEWGDPDSMTERERAAYQNHNHTPEQKRQLSLPPPVGRAVETMNTRMEDFVRTIPLDRTILPQAANIERFAQGVNTRMLSTIGLQAVDPGTALATARDAWVAENAALIKSIPQEVAQRVGDKVAQMVQQGSRWETIAKSLQEEHGIAERRARLIARDQTSKYNGNLNQVQQEAAGVTHYQWFGAMDARERPTHVAMQGIIVAWDKPPPIGHPGSEIQCRCVSVPVINKAKIAMSTPVTQESLDRKVKALGPRIKDL